MQCYISLTYVELSPCFLPLCNERLCLPTSVYLSVTYEELFLCSISSNLFVSFLLFTHAYIKVSARLFYIFLLLWTIYVSIQLISFL